jgi:transglutaminase-like putative cysteine protease
MKMYRAVEVYVRGGEWLMFDPREITELSVG